MLIKKKRATSEQIIEPVVASKTTVDQVLEKTRKGWIDVPEGTAFYVAAVDDKGNLSMAGGGSAAHTLGIAFGMLANAAGMKLAGLRLEPISKPEVSDGQELPRESS